MNQHQKPILVTGATGYVASHCIKQLLEQGYKVRGTVRSLANQSKNAFLYQLVPEKHADLELVEADLLKPETWFPAVEGVDYVLHVASPLILDNVKDENVLIRPAVEGTQNVLQASLAKGVKKVVVTSSCVSIMVGNEGKFCGPQDWSIEERCDAYSKSKVKAEKAVWKFWEENREKIEIATVLPSLVTGPLLTCGDGSSEKLIRDILIGKLPGLPKIKSGIVDVRDVAQMHIKVLFSPDSNGKRYITSSEDLWFKDVSQVLQQEFGKYKYKVTKCEIPNFMIKIAGLFNNQAKLMKPMLGAETTLDNGLSKREFNFEYLPIARSLTDMVESLINLGIVPDQTK